MSLDSILTIVQICFYLTAGCVGVLTYLKARDGLLNTVNTEYQKRAMDRLQQLSEELYSEYDIHSESFWANDDPVRDALKRLDKEIRPARHEIITKKLDFPIPVPPKMRTLRAWASRVRSDPFIPRTVRDKVVTLLEKRAATFERAFLEVMEKYKLGLQEGKYWDNDFEHNHGWIHNQINERMNNAGVGIRDVEDEVHEIRDTIQRYFERFDPIG